MISVIIQARMGSTRLPGKTLADIAGMPMLARLIQRVKNIPGPDMVGVATTNNRADEAIVQLCQSEGIPFTRGSEEDVLGRFYQAAQGWGSSVIIRITPDCPLLDPSVSGQVLGRFMEARGSLDYVSNTHPPTYPDGLDTEVFTFEALEIAWREATLNSDREHMTQFILRQPHRFRISNVIAEVDLSHLRWTVDEVEDLEFVRKVYRGMARRGWHDYRYSEVIRVIEEDGLQDASRHYRRDEGLIMSMQEDGLSPPAVGESDIEAHGFRLW